MLFRLQFFLAVALACGLPVLGQDQSATSSERQAYSDKLRANSEDPQSNPATDTDPNHEAYKRHLRELSGDDSDAMRQLGSPSAKAQNEKPARGPSSAVTRRPTAKTVTSSAEATSAMGAAKSISLTERTSDQHSKATDPSKTQSADLPLISGQNKTTVCDSYCQELRRTADGEAPIVPESLIPGQTNTTAEHNFIKNVAFDQMHIWTSPFKLRDADATWAVPFGVATGALVATDRDVSKEAATPSRIDISKQISDAGLYTFIGAGAGFYGLGLMTHDDHKRETGLLSGEAAINAALVGEALKLAFGRQRPFEGDGFGHIGKGGDSFPSEHAMLSWSIASVLAREYPNPFVQIGAYGLASAVSISRVTAGEHFPSDVFVGSTFGYLIGRKIYKDRHNPELGGAEYGTFVREHTYDADHSGSAYVPLESWVYPVIDRLSAMGIVHSNFNSERPWTRLECARLTAEAEQNTAYDYDDEPADIRAMIDSLHEEFSREGEIWAGGTSNRSVELESVYTRETEIAGPVLRDGFNFGQTLINDYGRPYGRGLNSINGFSARATSGPLVFYFRGEYQTAPSNPPYSEQTRNVMTFFDDGAPPPVQAFPATKRFQVLDAYLGLNLAGNQLSLGQQSLWWGPGTGGDFMLTNNAEPLNMIRLNRVSPMEIPLLSRFLGPLRYDIFLGQTDGYRYILSSTGLQGPHLGTQPFIQGARFTFKPTPNFEFGLTKTTVFGGTGYPLTAGYLYRATFTTANYEAGAAKKPGDRRSGVDITYRIPKLRDRLSFYLDEFSEDEISPLFVPRRSAMHPGIYMAKLPKLPKMDLRVEGVYTDIPSFGYVGFFYANGTYKNGFTKDGNLLGSWIGREGRGFYATSTIWFTPRRTLMFGYREAVADREFIEGGRYQDEFVRGTFTFLRNWELSPMVQYEYWRFPALNPLPQTNFTSSVQLTYFPQWGKKGGEGSDPRK